MTVVSTKEFNTNQDKYFDMAISEQIFIQRDDYMFIVARVTDRKIVNNQADTSSFSCTSKLSDRFRGVFPKEVGNDFKKHTKDMREEWDSI